jgi:hypothetical protein
VNEPHPSGGQRAAPRPSERETSGERGSLVIALAVILVLSGLTLAVLARTVSALGSARVSQDTASAVNAADAGVADALYVLSHTAVTGPGTVSRGSGSFSWTATLTSDFAGTVTSTGTINRRSHTVTVDVSRRRQWPWIVATSGSLVLDGPDIISSNLSPADPGEPAVADGGGMVLRNSASGGAQQELLGPGASCSGCTNPVSPPLTTTLVDPEVPTAPAPATLSSCTGITTLTTGTYLCEAPLVSFGPGAVSVGPGPVDLYVEDASGPSPTVSFADAQVNVGGDASQFVIHVVGAGIIQPGDGVAHAGTLWGIIDAPRSSLRSADCEFTLRGAADLGSFDCLAPLAGPGPVLTYDGKVAAIPATTWRETDYRDVAGP